MAHSVPPLPYAFDALEPHIDAQTMEIHHDKHHAAYVEKLNGALEKAPDLASMSLEELLKNVKSKAPDSVKQAIINNGGGAHNHAVFWEIMGPNGGGDPTGPIADALKSDIGDFATVKKTVNDNGATQFGSGWSWIVFNPSSGKLEAIKRPNQDSPLMDNLVPIFGVDVWEHAYYLKYQNKRPAYLEAWWNTLNWDAINDKFKAAKG